MRIGDICSCCGVGTIRYDSRTGRPECDACAEMDRIDAMIEEFRRREDAGEVSDDEYGPF